MLGSAQAPFKLQFVIFFQGIRSERNLIETLQGICREQLGADASDIDFLPFSDLEQSVREDIELIRSSPLIAKDTPVTGFVYDVKTGKIHEVV